VLCRSLCTLRVAGVPEHFNAPFHLAKERGLYEERGVAFEWDVTPQGTGAMAQKLESHEVDLAVMLSEGAVARVAQGAPLKVVGTYVGSPLRWGIHVLRGSTVQHPDQLKGRTFGVSRMLSGSHLMAHVFAHQKGWKPEFDAPVKLCGTLDGARDMMKSGEIETFLWEKFTTKHLVDAGEWDIIGEVLTPWPCFLFVASKKALLEKPAEIRAVIEVTKPVCDSFKANGGGATLAYVSKHHAVAEDDAKEWLDGTFWSCSTQVQWSTLDKTQDALRVIGQLREAIPHDQLVAQGICEVTSE